MANSLLDIKPHKVSRDLRGYSVMFYGEPKSGKTTIASKFPNALLTNPVKIPKIFNINHFHESYPSLQKAIQRK